MHRTIVFIFSALLRLRFMLATKTFGTEHVSRFGLLPGEDRARTRDALVIPPIRQTATIAVYIAPREMLHVVTDPVAFVIVAKSNNTMSFHNTPASAITIPS